MVLSAIAPVPPAQAASSSDLNPIAQPAHSSQLLKQRRPRPPRVDRPAPPRRLPPNRTRPGGGLDAAAQSCAPDNPPLTALVPEANPVYTAAARPTFLFHIPDQPSDIARAEFILLTADEKTALYSIEFSSIRSGVVSVSLPESAGPELTNGEVYHWYLNVYCQESDRILSVNGWVQRIFPEQLTALSTDHNNSADLPLIWYDELAQIADVLATNNVAPPEASQTWERWLTAIGLDSVIDASVVGPISPTPESES